MKNFKMKGLILALVTVVTASTRSFTINLPKDENAAIVRINESQNQTVNLFVTHGHCSTPFGGLLTKFQLTTAKREDLGNPLEDMELTFSIDPKTFKVCASDELTARIKTPGLFVSKKSEMIIFRSTEVFVMGVDWYQVNGKLSIKGVEREVKLFVTGIREPRNTASSAMVLQGRLNLYDWGIDYDKIVNGDSAVHSTQWMYLNMKVELG